MTYVCKKQRVVALIINTSVHPHRAFIGDNYCLNEIDQCPRIESKTGTDYHHCKELCNQPAHAEINALNDAGSLAKDAVMYITGHKIVCDDCFRECIKRGIKRIYLVDIDVKIDLTDYDNEH